MNTDGLLQCPNCLRLGKKQILGRVLENGQFLILRHHNGTTLVQAMRYSIVCGCGWSFDVNCGTIVLNKLSLLANGEGKAVQAVI